ncbi:MAG: flagellar hook protein FlgE [Planctomycetes bacterium]|nr:flagellar hook protein FlgE [Planctomycetota bacterium]
MSLTSAMLTGLTGIKSNQFRVETIGQNVANVNTTAFKSSRATFETLFVRTLAGGTAPSDARGGTNPVQVGYGSGLAATQQNFTQGTSQRTGIPSDLAIDGDGLFILNTTSGDPVYTRDGSFTLNSDTTLVSANGSFVQGFAASTDGTIESGSLTNLQIPLGVTAQAAATTEAVMTGNLDAAAEVAATGSVSVSNALVTGSGTAATAATPLSQLADGDGNALFGDGDAVTIRGVQKGGIDLPTAQFVVGTDGVTLGDFAAFIENLMALDTSDDAIGSPGVTIGDGTLAPAGTLVITSNAGDVNAISIDATSIRNNTTGVTPFTFTTTPATGEGVTTSFIVFDSLGTPLELRVRMALESKDTTGTSWRFNVETVPVGGVATQVGTGSLSFDQNGRFVAATGTDIQVPVGATGAVSPLAVSLDFAGLNGLTSAAGASTLAMASQNGFAEGTMVGFEIGSDGVITGTFSNGQKQALAQIALATFANSQGLVAQSENTFVVGVNSGSPVVSAPLVGSAGRIESGALELSNVDLPRELIGLLTASAGFSASSRIVRVADDLLQEMLLLAR